MGAGWPVLPLPHEVDARARSGVACDGGAALQPVGERARGCRMGRVHRRQPPHGVEDEHRFSRPLVSTMGQHDPLEGFIICTQLRATAAALPNGSQGPRLDAALAAFESIIAGGEWATADPLGVGGLLTDAWRVEQLVARGALPDV